MLFNCNHLNYYFFPVLKAWSSGLGQRNLALPVIETVKFQALGRLTEFRSKTKFGASGLLHPMTAKPF